MGKRLIFVTATALQLAGYFAFAWPEGPAKRIGWAVISLGAIYTYASWLGLTLKTARVSGEAG